MLVAPLPPPVSTFPLLPTGLLGGGGGGKVAAWHIHPLGQVDTRHGGSRAIVPPPALSGTNVSHELVYTITCVQGISSLRSDNFFP
jgi:hypothetical protein